MPSAKLLFRAARRLHEAWPRQPPGTLAAERPLALFDGRVRVAQRTRQRLAKAVGRGLSLAAARLARELPRNVEALWEAVSQARAALAQPQPACPTVADLAAELRQIEAEFDILTIHWEESAVAATTEPITLKDVSLGAFEIRLCWGRLVQELDAGCFAIVALDPHPAAANEHVTHPHVHRERLCAGDAKAALKKALSQGRLADAFCLVRSVLRHYNSGSPHVPLDEWDGSACDDCGDTVDRDQLSSCAGCGHDCCNNCLSRCPACQNWFCDTCLVPCAVCSTDHSRGCLHRTPSSQRLCCPGCLKPCAGCGRTFARDELDAPTGRCDACRDALPTSSSPEPLAYEEPHDQTLEAVGPAAG